MVATCSAEGCKKKAMIDGRGLCYIHGDKKQYCRVDGCDNLIQNQFKCIFHGAKKKNVNLMDATKMQLRMAIAKDMVVVNAQSLDVTNP
jgi:hypothetical protein